MLIQLDPNSYNSDIELVSITRQTEIDWQVPANT